MREIKKRRKMISRRSTKRHYGQAEQMDVVVVDFSLHDTGHSLKLVKFRKDEVAEEGWTSAIRGCFGTQGLVRKKKRETEKKERKRRRGTNEPPVVQNKLNCKYRAFKNGEYQTDSLMSGEREVPNNNTRIHKTLEMAWKEKATISRKTK